MAYSNAVNISENAVALTNYGTVVKLKTSTMSWDIVLAFSPNIHWK